MKLTLEFFGPLQDRMGQAETIVDLAAAPADLTALIGTLAPILDAGEALRDPHLRVAINDQICGSASMPTLKDNDRVAFLSPFSGG
tara:strand:+ start:3240 stop:3497 length:258 start_codon:yes stop_codon:yes gene_type:complete